MKRVYIFYFLLLGVVVLSSCDNVSTDLGTVPYYDSFLWSEGETDTLRREFTFEFNADAKSDPTRYAEFAFMDNDGKPLHQGEMEIYVNGVKLRDNRFKVMNNESSKELKFTFSADAKSGKHQGYLRLVGGNLDRIDNIELLNNEAVNVFQWTIRYDKQMNPLKELLMWIGIVILALLLFWFMVLRPALYPHFRAMVKSVIISKDGRIINSLKVKFTGACSVVFYNKREKQSLFKRLFVGRTVMLVDPIFVDKLRFSPRKIGGMAIGGDYQPTPNPFPRNGILTINYPKQGVKIELK